LLDEDEHTYLTDFGIAKNLGNPNLNERTAVGAMVGSPAYISPEQIKAEPVRPQADIYCLGLLFYEMLTGRKAFPGPTSLAYIQQHLNDPLPPLADAELAQPLLAALDSVIARATVKDPHSRYPDVLTFLAEVQTAVSTQNGRTITQIAALSPEEVAELENPYQGLRPFGIGDSDNFFGRDTMVQELLSRLADTDEPPDTNGRGLARFLAIVGPSGSGKSSVVRAGLMPALRQGGVPGSENWFMVDMIPGTHPLEELEAALLRVAVNPPDSLLEQLRANERGLIRAAKRILPADDGTELLLIIDQFEEIFTLVENEADRSHFLGSLVTAVVDPRSRIHVIITLRADFTDRPLRYVDFGELVHSRTEFILPLSPDELEQVITKPAQQCGLIVEPDLVAAMIHDVADQPGTLPLLQYTLTELFERRDGRTLTLNSYHEIGGISGALARRADEIYAGLDEDGRTASRQLFLRLTTLGEGVEDTRRRVRLSELESLSDHRSAITDYRSLLTEYGRYRLLTFDRDPLTREPTVEVAHEALLRQWPRLRHWLAESRDDVRLQRRLAAAVAEWAQANQDAGFLLRGSRLDLFADWQESSDLALTETEKSFLTASLRARQERAVAEQARQQRELETAQQLAETQSRSARRLRRLAVGLATILLLAIGAAWFAFNQQKIAQRNFETAERTRLAAQAQLALDRGEDVIVPALLALQSLQYGYSPEADAALLNALSRGFARQQFIGHTDALAAIDFAPDGQYVLTGANDTTVRLWDAQTGQEIRRFNGHAELVTNAIFSPDGKRILTSSADRTVRLWDVETGQEVGRLPKHNSPVWALAISPDGQTILTGDESGSAWLWDLQTTQMVRELSGHGDIVLWGAFSPDGRAVFTGSLDKTARLWEVEMGQELRRFEGHAAAVSGGQFSPDGRFLATASYDNTARLWAVETGQEVRRFIGHTNIIGYAIFSPDGRFLATASHDKTARLWNVETGQEIRQFIGHTATVDAVVFSPDGQQILTGSVDRTARLWDISLESEPRIFSRPFRTIHGTDVVWAGFSAGGEQLLIGNGDGTVQVWQIQSGQISSERSFETDGLITNVTFSSDNVLALTTSGDGLAQLWQVESGQPLSRFAGHTGAIWDADFSPDSHSIVTGSEDGTARVWDVRSGTELHQLAGHAGPVRAAAFSPDGRYLLTGGDDGLVRQWDAPTGQEIRQFGGHTGSVLAVAFSPDGQTILTGSSDRTAWLWEVESGQVVYRFIGHTDQIWVVTFSPDGRYVLTGSNDGTARLWEAATGQIVRQFVGHASLLRSLAFSPDGQYVLTGDLEQAYLWQANLADLIAKTCAQLPRDFTAGERALYRISDDTPTCAR
jgi:WD40 repeat protein